MFDGSGWEIVDRDEQGAIVRKYGFDGDDYYDQIVGEELELEMSCSALFTQKLHVFSNNMSLA